MPTTFEIHPTIGIARLGTSDEFFLGPEPGSAAPTTYRNTGGDRLRQAARFRIFRCDRDAAGVMVASTDVTATSTIDWKVTLANRKGVHEQFAPSFPTSTGRRNNATGNDANPLDASLIIGPVSLSATGKSLPTAPFPAGSFKGTSVNLGDLATDSIGALIVLGGRGRSDSVPARASGPSTPPLQSFADSDGWFDDISDGPVEADITLADGTTPSVQSAWVIVAPPDNAPFVENLVTLYDAAFQVAVDAGMLKAPSPVSFSRHVMPILARPVAYRSVIRLARQSHGGTGSPNFSKSWATLSAKATSGPTAALVLRRLRAPGAAQPVEPVKLRWMPRLHDENNNDQVLPVTKVQHDILVAWSTGAYNDDFASPPAVVELEPDALDRVALQACSGGAFFPGIEVGRIMKDASTYVAPFRIDPSLKPGTLTAGNALPWQADYAACRFEAQVRLGWWPAQRPDQVLTAAGQVEVDWGFGANSDIDMVNNWSELGVVFVPGNDPITGEPMFFEDERTLPRP